MDDIKAKIEAANTEAVRRMNEADPVLVDIAPAGEVIPGLKDRMVLHSGPPVDWQRMSGAQRGSMLGAAIFEGWAKDAEEAMKLFESGAIRFEPNHSHQSVGPMAGTISGSMPVWIVENRAFANRAFCRQVEPSQQFGSYSDDALQGLRLWRDVWAPALKKGLVQMGGLPLKPIIAKALQMGDELHNRNRAATSLLYRALAPAIVTTCPVPKIAAEVLDFIHHNDHFFLNLSMAASKATLDAARNIPFSSLVVAMARNGTDFGVQLAGTREAWFTGPAEVPDALYFPGYSRADANPDIGDSAITETNGLGGFAIAAAPAIVQFVGGRAGDALRYTLRMYEITEGENNVYRIPALDFRGTPTGIDVIRVVEKNVLPFIDTGVAHKNPGVGQIGAGVLNAPLEPFKKAFEELARRMVKG